MFKDITIGQYFPGDSIIHRLDPRIKIITSLLFIVAIFYVERFAMYLPLVGFIAMVVYVAKLPLGYVVKGVRPLLPIILITLIINVFMTPGIEVFRLGFLVVTKEGLVQASFMAMRLLLLVTGTSLLTLTTSPITLTDGLERLFSPLKTIGFPASELAMMITIALRFIPTLFEETDKIMKAQMARGADFESGNVINRAKNLVPLLVPLFINAFRRADELSTAMEARCYQVGKERTRLNDLKITKADAVVGLGIHLLGAVIAAKYVL